MGQGRDERAVARQCAVVLSAVYGLLAVLVLTEKWGRATNDTRLELTEVPGRHLAGTLTMWNPDVSLGEMQNQAYGYLFPHGSFFALLDLLGSPGWLSQRLWSVLLLLVACEGVRRLARALAIGPWAAAAAGLAYGLAPRHVTEIGVRSNEVLPGAVLPWALLPLVLAVQGRLRPRNAAVLSAAAFACSGGVNGTATAAPAALLAIVVLWAVLTRRLSWRFAAGWLALVGAVSAWWILSLLRLGAYSPPFYDFVEDARATTSSSDFTGVFRGASNWVGYVTVGGQRWWPAGYDLAYEPWLVLAAGLVAAFGFVGLMRLRGPVAGPWRRPLLLAAAFGVVAQVAAHRAGLDGPFAQALQDLLDGPLAPLRNVPKVDPVLRVPVAIGVGVFADDLLRACARRRDVRRRGVPAWLRRGAAVGLALGLVAGLAGMAQPIASADTRTRGWEAIPSYWTDAADYVASRPGTTWVIPGSGFGIQRWGWTMEETMEAVGKSPWVTRSQVPLTPPDTIRMLSALEALLATGSGSPYLRHMLNRLGIESVLVRHDLVPEVSQATPSALVGVALGRSPGIKQVATFGKLEFGPAIEVFAVEPALGARTDAGGYDVRDVADAVTVAGSVEDAVAAVGAGLVGPAQPMVLAGAEGWTALPTVVGDAYRLRERSFSQIHDAESNVMAPGERYRGNRVVPNYPVAGAEPVVAEYDGIAGVDASTSRAWADSFGNMRAENAPWAALDGDTSTWWQTGAFTDAAGQWLEVSLEAERHIGTVTLREPVSAYGVDRVTRWRVSAGSGDRAVTREVEGNPFTGEASVDLDTTAASVRVEVLEAPARQSAVGLAELSIDGVRPTRTMVMPFVETDGPPDVVLSARPEARACVPTLLGPDCDRYRQRASEEQTGIDRTLTLDSAGQFLAKGIVVARSTTSTAELLQPQAGVTMRGSSWLSEDPSVSPRMAYDDNSATSWVADPRDPAPVLTIDLGRERTVRRLMVDAPGGIAIRPDHATITATTAEGDVERDVDLTGLGRFEPVTARRLTITFRRDVPSIDNLPIGLSELVLGGAQVSTPLDGAGPTGSVCGYGPKLVVDGTEVPTRVTGLIGDVISDGQLSVEPCGKAAGAPLALAAGEHRIQLLSTSQFEPVGLTLAPTAGPAAEIAASAPQRSRDVRLESETDDHVVLHVGAGDEAILSAPHNVNAGWVARVDGRELQRITVDGWAQGWVVPADVSGQVDLVFTPQRGYLVVLFAGLGVLGAVLLWALAILGVMLSRRIRGGRRTDEAGDRGATSSGLGGTNSGLDGTSSGFGRLGRIGRIGRLGGALVAAVVGYVLLGPVVGTAAGVGVLLARWPRVAQAVVLLLLVGPVVVFAVQLADAPGAADRALDLVIGAALGVAVAAGLATSASPAGRRIRRDSRG